MAFLVREGLAKPIARIQLHYGIQNRPVLYRTDHKFLRREPALNCKAETTGQKNIACTYSRGSGLTGFLLANYSSVNFDHALVLPFVAHSLWSAGSGGWFKHYSLWRRSPSIQSPISCGGGTGGDRQ
ncbi:MAG: hypothetical protein ACFCA4_12190 [Cyanophyceae cyanobacterium]